MPTRFDTALVALLTLTLLSLAGCRDKASTSTHNEVDANLTDAEADTADVADIADAAERPCLPFGDTTKTGEIADSEVDEASGLAASWRHPDLLWTHNDSGGEPRLFLIAHDGSTAAVVHLGGNAENIDWEDVAVGPCEAGSSNSCVYAADVGDNDQVRDEVVIYRFSEPDLPGDTPADITVEDFDTLWFAYPNGPLNVETLLVQPESAAIYVVEKTSDRDPGVYRIPGQPNDADHPATAVEVGHLHFGDSRSGSLVTAGDVSPDGHEFTIRTYTNVFTFCAGGGDFESAFDATPVQSQLPLMGQAEALGYSRDGQTIWLTSEGRPAPIYRADRSPAP